MAKTARLILHPSTEDAIAQLIRKSSHAVLITGMPGGGKSSLAEFLASGMLGMDAFELEKYPYLTTLRSIDNKAIPIDSIRELQKYMTLKIPGGREGIARVAIIENAQLLTTEAQNALLKTLEEPPEDTVLIATATSAEALLPTIRSRMRVVNAVLPPLNDLKDYFLSQNYKSQDIEQALLVSGGLPGLTHALLNNQETHPLFEAVLLARKLLQAKAYERLLLVDGLSKQKQLAQDTCFILGQMSRMALSRGHATSTQAVHRWQRVIKASYEASVQLKHNTQAKLVLMKLMLEL